jgi:hypothetical protein
MYRLANRSLFLILFFVAALTAAPRTEYFTDEELDLIRDAQELSQRLTAFFKLAEKRLVVLGVSKKTEKEIETERKQLEQYEKERKNAGDKADKVPKPVTEYDYLFDFTRTELLRGYIQAIDEVMSNLEDSYSRKLDVRDALEDLEKFTTETLPKLEKLEPRNEAETLAKASAIEKAQEALDGAKEALTKVPKTEKKKK